MTHTPRLNLPFVAAGQAQKHVTHNEALRIIDALVQATAINRTLAAPPASPADGDCHIVAPTGASGAFAGHENAVAVWQDGSWVFMAPQVGWRVFVVDEEKVLVYGASGWAPMTSDLSDSAARLGINTDADDNNRLAVRSASVLLTNEGTDQKLFLNKQAPANTASVVFQTNFSGRGEFGTTGDDNIHLKVSTDGTNWKEAVTVNGATANTNFSGTIESTVPPLDANDATNMALYKAVVPGIVNSAGGNDTQEFSIRVVSGKWTQGPTGHANYTDQVFGIGWNMSPVFLPLDPTKPSTSFRIESKFAQGAANSAFGSEVHISQFPTDSGIDRRYFSAFLPHRDADAHESSVLLASRRVDLQDYGGVQAVTFDFAAARRVTFYNLETFFTTNNKPVARQLDSTGSTSVALPYIDSTNAMAISGAIVTPAPAGTLAGNSQGPIVRSRGATTNALTVEAPNANSADLNFFCGTTQAASAAIPVTANATTTFTFAAGAIQPADLGRTITGANVPANTTITELTTATSAKASQALPANVISVTMSARARRAASFGVDSGNNFVIKQGVGAAGGALYADIRANTGGLIIRDADAGLANLFQIAYGAVVANRPFKPGTYTLATLPAASSFAGHLIWVSNATGGAKLCVSDGAAWKIVSLGATVS